MDHSRRRGLSIVRHGVALMLAGLLWGLVVPHTPYPRLALGAHIQFGVNGLALLGMGLVLTTLSVRVGSKGTALMLLSAWLTWVVVLSEVANAWWGTKDMLPLAAAEAGAPGGAAWQEAIVGLAHVVPSLTIIPAWGLLLWGLRGTTEPGQVGTMPA